METLDIEKKFGTAIKRWREKHGLSQEQLAERADLHRTYVCDVERGTRNISLRNAQKLADALSLPLAALFSGADSGAPAKPARGDEMVDILLVEDSEDDIALTLANLKKWNISNRIYVLRNGDAALNFLFGTGEFSHRLPGDQPQIVLLDLNLPGTSGIEVLQRAKADPRTSSIPFVVMTSSKYERDIVESKRLGVEDYILKPADFQSFSEVSLRLNLQWALMRPKTPALA